MLEKFLPRQEFSSYEDFKANYKVTIPDRFNFAYDVVDAWAEQDDHKPALAWLGQTGTADPASVRQRIRALRKKQYQPPSPASSNTTTSPESSKS